MTSPPEREPFKRSIGLLTLTALGLNSVIGTGIFTTPGDVAHHLGGWGIVAFGLGGLLCYGIALCFAEMSARVPLTGGAYAYSRATFGPLIGYLVGWAIWLSAVVGWASVVVPLADLLAPLMPAWAPLSRPVIIVLVVVSLSLLNWLGTRVGAASNTALAALKMLPLCVFLLWCLPRLRSPVLGTPLFSDWVAGLLAVLYTFSGFEEIPVPAGETENPQRTIPQALAMVLGISTVVYMIAQAAVCSLGVAATDQPLAAAAAGVGWLLVLLSAASLISMASVNASIAFTGPRSLWALTRWRWQWLAHLHPTFNTPYRAILVTAGVVLCLALTNGFERLVALSVLASLLQYLPTVLAVLVWRWRERKNEGDTILCPPGFRVAGGPIVPIMALLVCLLLLATSDRKDLEVTAEAVVVGAVLYFVRREQVEAPS